MTTTVKLSMTLEQQETLQAVLAWMDRDGNKSASGIVVGGMSEGMIDAWQSVAAQQFLYREFCKSVKEEDRLFAMCTYIEGRLASHLEANPLPPEIAEIVAKPKQGSLFD